MRLMVSILIIILFSHFGCDKNDCSESCSIYGFWEVTGIIVEEVQIQKESTTDSIMIEFQSDGTIIGSSSRNLITGHLELYVNDSIWISTIGGTEVNNTNWEKKFREIMPLITFFEFKGDLELVLYSSSRKSKINFYKHKEL